MVKRTKQPSRELAYKWTRVFLSKKFLLHLKKMEKNVASSFHCWTYYIWGLIFAGRNASANHTLTADHLWFLFFFIRFFTIHCFTAVKSNTAYAVQNLATYLLLIILHLFNVGMFLYSHRSRIYLPNHFGHKQFYFWLRFLNYPLPFCTVRL